MTYDIFSTTAPTMLNTGRGTHFIKFILSQASREMREPLVPMVIPALATHLPEASLMSSDNTYYDICGQMGHLIGPSGFVKALQRHLLESIMRAKKKTLPAYMIEGSS